MSATGTGYRTLHELEKIRPTRTRATSRGRALLNWLTALLWCSAFFAGVFCPYVWWKR